MFGILSLLKSTSAVDLWHSLGCQRCRVRLVVKPTIIASLSACKKVAQSINSFLKYSINISPVFDHDHAHFQFQENVRMDGQVDSVCKTLPATTEGSTEKGKKGAFFIF